MVELQYIVAPLMGGVIGYITNDIAIRMLFRPHKGKYIFGMKLPFTPGIIPKEKGRIAKAIGGAISENLMSKDVLEKNLLSEEMLAKIRKAIDGFFESQKCNPETIREFLLHYLSEEEVRNALCNVKQNLSEQVAHSLKTANLGDKIAEMIVEHLSAKLRVDGLDVNIPQLLRQLLGGSLWGQIAALMEKPAKHFLSKNINQMLENKGAEMADGLIGHELDDLANLPMRQLLEGKEQQMMQITESCMGLYRMVITEHLPRILETIDIPAIIESRINEMDMDETEKLIFQVMDKELRAIVWLGALLGLVMGCVNLVF